MVAIVAIAVRRLVGCSPVGVVEMIVFVGSQRQNLEDTPALGEDRLTINGFWNEVRSAGDAIGSPVPIDVC
jgi:hypothetical protein